MDKFILYLLESSVILTFLYLLYILILRKETFFSLNRFFLIGSLIFSLLFPLLSFDFNRQDLVAIEQPIQQVSNYRISYHEAMSSWDFEGQNTLITESTSLITNPEESSLDQKNILLAMLLIIYVIGISVCLSKTFWAFRWVRSLITSNPSEKTDEMIVVKVSKPIAPFSFLKYVFVHTRLVEDTGYDQILAHEKTHVKQRHSIDLIFVQLMAACFWFNPVIWLLIKSLKTTHEYIADSKIIDEGYSLVEYQALLLKQLISNNSYGLVHNFNLSFIKKRITMMKNRKSGWSGKVRVALTIASVMLFGSIIVQCNSVLEEHSAVNNNVPANGDSNLAKLGEFVDEEEIDKSEMVSLTISNSIITLQGEKRSLKELPKILRESSQWQNKDVLAKIDANTPMSLAGSVFFEFRRFNVRKFVFEGLSLNGNETSYLKMILPPRKNFEVEIPIEKEVNYHEDSYLVVKPSIGKEVVMEKGSPFLGIVNGVPSFRVNSSGVNLPLYEHKHNLSNDLSAEIKDFVRTQIGVGRSDYLVMPIYSKETLFKEFINTASVTRKAFLSVYDNIAREKFGKKYTELNKAESSITREGIPMSIMINGGSNWTYDYSPN